MDRIIAEFGIGTDALIKEASDAKRVLDSLLDTQKKLKDGGDTSSQTFVENASRIKALRSEYNTYTKAISQTVDETGKANRQTQLLNTELGKNATSIKGAREQNKKLLAIRNQLNLKTTEGVRAQTEINKKLDENNNFIKANVSELEKQKINVGNYQGAIEGALQSTGLFGANIKGVTTDLKNIIQPISQAVVQSLGLSRAQQGITASTSASTKALRVFKVALISTGIGAIVVAIGALVAGFASTQAGADAISRALAPLKGAFQGIIGVVQNIALNFKEISSNVFDQFKDNFTILVNSFLLGADRIRLAWANVFGDDDEIEEAQNRVNERLEETREAIERTRERAKGFIDAVKEAGNAIGEAAQRQQEIVELGIQIEEQENLQIIRRSELNAQLKEQEQIAKDTTLSTKERNDAISEAKRLSDELAQSETNILNLKIQQKELENAQNDTSREDQAELNNLIAQRNDQETAARARELKFLGSRSSIVKEQQAKAKKAQQEAIKDQETLLKLFILQNDLEGSALEDKIKLTQEVLDKELAIIDAKQNAGLSQDEADLLRIQAKNKLLEDQAQITLDNAQQELELFLLQNDAILNNDERLNQQLLESKASFYDERARLQIEALEAEGLNEDEFFARRAIIESEREALKADDKAKFKDIQNEEDLERERLDFENRLILLEEQDATQFEIDQARRDRDRQLKIDAVNEELISEQDKATRINAINREADEADIRSKQILQDQKLSIAQGTLGQVAELLGRETAAGKAAAIAQATINTYQGVTEVWRAKSILPEPFGTAAKLVSTATVLASGLQSVGAIRSTQTRAAKGISFQGTLKGNSHANGGIDLGNGIEAEGGENLYTDGNNSYIVNKKASSLINQKGILGALSTINQSVGGGVPLTTASSYLNNGGLVTSNLQSPSSINQGNRNVIQGISDNINTIRVVNIAEDTISVAEQGILVQNEANL